MAFTDRDPIFANWSHERIITERLTITQSVRDLLKNGRLYPMDYTTLRGDSKRLYIHQFTFRDSESHFYSYHVMRDLKDAALAIIHEAQDKVYYSRILMENVFLYFRHMILFERRLTLWGAPDKEEDMRLLRKYSPFFLYRDLWAALLSPYWTTNDEVYADHISQTAAEYFAQLLPSHPCRAVEHGWKDCSGNKLCGGDNFPQVNCVKQLNPVLVAAFAECVCANGHLKAGRAEQLLDGVMEAVRDHCPHLAGQLWLFLVDWMLGRPTKPKPGSQSYTASDDWIKEEARKAKTATEEAKNAPQSKEAATDTSMLISYAAARMAAGADFYKENIYNVSLGRQYMERLKQWGMNSEMKNWVFGLMVAVG